MADVGLNDVKLLGRLVRDPELMTGGSGKHFCKFTLAVNRETGDQADFIRCVTFNETAKNLVTFMSKGSRILVEGAIQTGSYTDKGGNKVYTTDVIVRKIKYLESKNSNSYIQQQSSVPFNSPSFDDNVSNSGEESTTFLDIESDDLPF